MHDVHLVAVKHKSCAHPAQETAHARNELLKYCKSVHIVDISSNTSGAHLFARAVSSLVRRKPLTVAIYSSHELRDCIASLARTVDAAHFDTIGLAEYLPDVGGVSCVVTHHGAESFMIRRRIANERNPLKRLFFMFEWPLLREYEARMCPKFSTNVVMSELDRDILRNIAPAASFTVVANGVDLAYFSPVPPRKAGAHTIVFAGRLDQYANRHGIVQFMAHAWPVIGRAFPDSRIHIIGSNPPGTIERMAERDRRIEVHGFVADVRPYFREANVAICPVWDGGGTRIKVLDALAQAVPLVATSIGVEGIDVVDERDLLIADTPQAFVRQVTRLFEDATLGERLRLNGRCLAERVYSWDSLAKNLAVLYGHTRVGERVDGTDQAARRASTQSAHGLLTMK